MTLHTKIFWISQCVWCLLNVPAICYPWLRVVWLIAFIAWFLCLIDMFRYGLPSPPPFLEVDTDLCQAKRKD